MANVGQWELVVKGSKKKNVSVVNGKLSKTEKKHFTENAPKLNRFGEFQLIYISYLTTYKNRDFVFAYSLILHKLLCYA